MARAGFRTVQRTAVPEAVASISTNSQSRRAQAQGYGSPDEPNDLGVGLDEDGAPASIKKLHAIATQGGDISNLLDPGQVITVGTEACRQWETDKGSRAKWMEVAERSLAIAAQETDDDEEKVYPFDGAADIHYPILTTASEQFAARAEPALIKGDKVVGVKVFTPPAINKAPIEAAKASPDQPQNDQQAQQATQAIQTQEQQDAQHDAAMKQREARGERVKTFLNWLIFYQMDDWQGETDQLLHEIPIVGAGFKKIYMSTTGLCSDYVSALRLTVHNDTKSLARCPRVTQDFEVYPHEIETRRRDGTYRDIELPSTGDDPDRPRLFIEQHRLDDLDGDGLAEPYIVTIDVDTKQVMRIEPAFGVPDIIVNEEEDYRVIRIDRWRAFAAYRFLPDPRGRFYGIGFGKMLDSITDSIDTSMNQLIDAGNAEIAGGGFIGSSVRLQGSGQGGAVFFRPGEYQTVSTQGPELRAAIWERTVPHPSDVTFKLLELLLAAAKDIASVKDVITGNTPATAPVGTTLALQDQALQTFSAIYKRIYRGFADEFRLMYLTLKRFGGDKERKQYAELTNGDFDEDFTGDGTDIQPVADPAVVTKMQKIARNQALIQLAESPIGMAAGMTQPQQAQAIVQEALDAMDWDRPERFTGPVLPNPLEVAKAADMTAAAQLKAADVADRKASATLDHAKALRETGLAAEDTSRLHEKADHMAQTGQIQPAPPEGMISATNDQNDQAAQRAHDLALAVAQQPPVLAHPPVATPA